MKAEDLNPPRFIQVKTESNAEDPVDVTAQVEAEAGFLHRTVDDDLPSSEEEEDDDDGLTLIELARKRMNEYLCCHPRTPARSLPMRNEMWKRARLEKVPPPKPYTAMPPPPPKKRQRVEKEETPVVVITTPDETKAGFEEFMKDRPLKGLITMHTKCCKSSPDSVSGRWVDKWHEIWSDHARALEPSVIPGYTKTYYAGFWSPFKWTVWIPHMDTWVQKSEPGHYAIIPALETQHFGDEVPLAHYWPHLSAGQFYEVITDYACWLDVLRLLWAFNHRRYDLSILFDDTLAQDKFAEFYRENEVCRAVCHQEMRIRMDTTLFTE
jgi:hypothetical protein